MSNVLFLAEHSDGKLRKATLQALGAARGSAAGRVRADIATRAADRLAAGKRVVLAIDPAEVAVLRADDAEEP